jgi:UDP:flavonoid glycosyltransferase YjiC (YdhE family)
MARFLLTLWPFETHLHPNLALAHSLRRAGHEVAFYTGNRARAAVEGEGFRCFPFRAVNERDAEAQVDIIVSERLRPWRLRRAWREFLLGALPQQLQDIEAILSEWLPDSIVCDLALWGPILVIQEARHIPVAAFSHIGYCIVPGGEGKGWRRKLLARLVNLITAAVPREANELRRGYGLPPLGMRVTEFVGTLPLLLIPSSAEFDSARANLPASVHYVGPCSWPACPARMETGTRVVVHEGTLYAPRLTMLRAAQSALPGARIIAGKGRALNGFESWRPLGGVLEDAGVLVTNGNTEDVMEALRRGVPLVVVPSILDQSEMGWRVEASGAGLRLAERRCTPRRLRAAVERVLGDPAFRKNAQRMAAGLARHRGAAEAAELLGTLVHCPQPRS